MKSIAKIIKSFKNELAITYPLTEINSIIEIVFEHELGYSKTDLILKSENQLTEIQFERLKTILTRLKNNEPVQYVLKKTVFFDLDFFVAPGVLIPRQETEELIDWIIKDADAEKSINILDIGTGSGCIAITLAANLRMAKVQAYDISEKALEIAQKNASINKLGVDFLKIDILKHQQITENQKLDIIVSNPPYVLEKEKEQMAKNVLDYEPELALFVEDNDPLLFYKAITNYANLNLKKEGKLYFEINEAYGNEIKNLLQENGFKNVELRKDLNGKDRMICGSEIIWSTMFTQSLSQSHTMF
jgi:release factor glutamine methyltransferase